MANSKTLKKAILATGIIAITVVVVALVALSEYTTSAQADYAYAFNEENWTIAEENSRVSDHSAASVHTVEIYVEGYAFQRDEETSKQFKAETNLTIVINPEEENFPRMSATGTVKVNERIYSIENGTAVVGTKRRVLFIRCEGVDEEGNTIAL